MSPIAMSLEDRVANVLNALEGDESEAAGCARWLAANLLHARKGLADVLENLSVADPVLVRLVRDALEPVED